MTNTARKLLLGLLGGSSAAFSPLSIPGLALWLDASDASTLFQASNGTTPATADGDVVGYWGDKSGNGNNATQVTTANKPSLQLAEKNSKGVVRFDGGNDVLSAASVSLGAFGIFVVFRLTGGFLVLEHGNNLNTNDGCYLNSTSNATIGTRRSGVSTSKDLAPNWGNDNTWRVVAYQYDGTNAGHTLRVNSVTQSLFDVVANNPGTGTVAATFNIGNRADGSAGIAGDIAELVVISGAVSDANRNAVESYLNTKWAVY
jgi:hypothetical protein